MGWSHGTRWTDELIKKRLRPYTKKLGYMPSAKELARLEGDHCLATVIPRRGGFRAWAERMGVPSRPSESRKGNDWEDHEEAFFLEQGFEVEKMSFRHPFDFIVNGHRVDVKSAIWSVCTRKSGRSKGGEVRGFVFAGLKRGEHCDFFDLVCIEDDEVAHRFIVPAKVARIVTLTITERQLGGYGKYSQYEDAIELLE